MKFKEVKQRKDYKFILNGITNYIEDIRNGELDGFLENGDGDRGAVVMEVGYVDIEVNVYSAAQVKFGADVNDMTPIISYFICIKHDNGEWESDDYLSDIPDVDWNADDWIEQLEKDMFEKLDAYVTRKNYSYDNGN